MAENKNHKSVSESEFIAAFARTQVTVHAGEECLSRELLERFAEGLVVDPETQDLVLAHAGRCDSCTKIVVARRKGITRPSAAQKGRFRIPPRARVAMVMTASLLIAVLVWVWHLKQSSRAEPVVLVDLRVAAPTRSNGNVSSVKATSGTRQLVIILPESREAGQYEIELLPKRPNGLTVLHTTASTTFRGHSLQLIAVLDFSKVPRGNYQLAIRRANSDWEYLPIFKE